MRTGQQLKIEDYKTQLPVSNTPRKKATSVNLTDQESTTSNTTSKRRTKKTVTRQTLQESEELGSQADAESTPDLKKTLASRIPTSTAQRAVRSSVTSTPNTPQRLGKRKLKEQSTDHSTEPSEQAQQTMEADGPSRSSNK